MGEGVTMQRRCAGCGSRSRGEAAAGSLLLMGVMGLLQLLGGVSAELVQVQVVARAGARKWVPRNVERRQFGYGLLPAGYEQMEAVGQVLKARYLGPTAELPLANVSTVYKNGDALIRAVAQDQTASSAEAVAFGMWSPVTGPRGAKATPLTGGYQAVPVFTISRGMDYLLSGSQTCPAIDEQTQKFLNSTTYKTKTNETQKAREVLGKKLNMSYELKDMPIMYDRVLLNVKYGDDPSGGETLPVLTTAEFAQLKEMADFVEAGKYGNPAVGLLCGGPLLSEVFDRMAAVATGVKHRSLPLLIYMGSFSTLSCALSALKPTDPTLTDRIHNHGSLLVFELHKVGEEYYVNTLFMEGESQQFTRVFFGRNLDAACGEGGKLCPLADAKRIVGERMEPNLLDWCDRCGNSFQMPACIQSLQVKMSSSIDHSSKTSKRKRQMTTAGAAFLGIFFGALIALAAVSVGPALRRRWAERGGRAYSDSLDREGGGIEAPGAAGGGSV